MYSTAIVPLEILCYLCFQMRDYDIRNLLKEFHLLKYKNDGKSKVVEEFTITSAGARIDLAVINSRLHGFEIKSASDTLSRLPTQMKAYAKVFDYVSVVTEGKHYESLCNALPEWVGIYVCTNNKIRRIRKEALNTERSSFNIAKLLWKDELIDVLKTAQIPYSRKERSWQLCELIEKHMSPDQISKHVRDKLKKRTDWKT